MLVIVSRHELMIQSLLREPLARRRQLLRETFHTVDQKFQFATYMDGTDEETMQQFLSQAVEQNCEGLMVKTLEADATYEPSKRSNKWLKVMKTLMRLSFLSVSVKERLHGWFNGFA